MKVSLVNHLINQNRNNIKRKTSKARFNEKEKEPCNAVIKPDIVFFGEMLPERFWTLRERDVPLANTLICIGTSLEVYPFAGVADSVPYHTPRLLINRDLVGSFGTREKDCHMSGDLVKNIELLANKLGWSILTIYIIQLR